MMLITILKKIKWKAHSLHKPLDNQRILSCLKEMFGKRWDFQNLEVIRKLWKKYSGNIVLRTQNTGIYKHVNLYKTFKSHFMNLHYIWHMVYIVPGNMAHHIFYHNCMKVDYF